jgi:hypothetical protein
MAIKWNAGLLIALAAAIASSTFGQSFKKPSFIQWQLAGIRSESRPEIKRAKAEYLVENVNSSREGTVSDEDIDALASLRMDKDVQRYMAVVLGTFGPRARRSAPALVAAITEWHSQVGVPMTGIWPPSLMCDAVVKIDFSQRPAECAYW